MLYTAGWLLSHLDCTADRALAPLPLLPVPGVLDGIDEGSRVFAAESPLLVVGGDIAVLLEDEGFAHRHGRAGGGSSSSSVDEEAVRRHW